MTVLSSDRASMFWLMVSRQGTLGQDRYKVDPTLQILGGNPCLTDTHQKGMEIRK